MIGYGIPTVTVDYTNDTNIFDPDNKDHFQVDFSASRESNLYKLNKAIISAYRKSKLPVQVAREVAARNATQILDRLLTLSSVVEVSENIDLVAENS